MVSTNGTPRHITIPSFGQPPCQKFLVTRDDIAKNEEQLKTELIA